LTAGIGFFVAPDKDEFNGRSVLAEQMANGTKIEIEIRGKSFAAVVLHKPTFRKIQWGKRWWPSLGAVWAPFLMTLDFLIASISFC